MMYKIISEVNNFWGFMAVMVVVLLSIYKTNHTHTLTQRSDNKRKYTTGESNKILYFLFAAILLAIFLFFYTSSKKDEGKPIKKENRLLYENFFDNSNHWDLRNTPQGVAKIIDGVMRIQSPSFLIRDKEVDNLYKKSDNIVIKTELKCNSLAENGYSGFCWGLSESKGWFIVFRENQYMVGEIVNNKLDLGTNKWLKSNLLSSKQSFVLEIYKSNNKTELMFDGVKITSLSGMSFKGDSIGFITNKSEISVEYVYIEELMN